MLVPSFFDFVDDAVDLIHLRVDVEGEAIELLRLLLRRLSNEFVVEAVINDADFSLGSLSKWILIKLISFVIELEKLAGVLLNHAFTAWFGLMISGIQIMPWTIRLVSFFLLDFGLTFSRTHLFVDLYRIHLEL